MTPTFYAIWPSPLGAFSLVWREVDGRPRVYHILLPAPQALAEGRLRAAFPDARPRAHPAIAALGARLQRFLGGADETFSLELLALERCSDFQRRVLLAEYAIPRGSVSTYGRIARHLGVPGGARAVGGALAANPFPLVIPCHRAIRSDGTLGGFQGGLEMKRALLEYEGVAISAAGRVLSPHWHY